MPSCKDIHRQKLVRTILVKQLLHLIKSKKFSYYTYKQIKTFKLSPNQAIFVNFYEYWAKNTLLDTLFKCREIINGTIFQFN